MENSLFMGKRVSAMSQMLEIPDTLYDELRKVAEANGMTPVDWIAAHLATNSPAASRGEIAAPPQTLADLFAGRTGGISSGGEERLSESGGAKFTDYLQAKRKTGNL
jgi:hypothetical protein